MAKPKVETQTTALGDQSGASLALVVSDAEIARKYAMALVPMSESNTTAKRIAAYTRLLETPFVSGRAAAEAETIVTILAVTDGEIPDMLDPTIMHEQHLFLVRLQTPLVYTDSARKEHDHREGDEVILGLRKSRVRDGFVEIMRADLDAGGVLPNLLVAQVPSTKPGWAPATTFRQLFPDRQVN